MKTKREYVPAEWENLQLQGFSEACFNDNSVAELVAALDGPADTTDCDNWQISPETWRMDILDALRRRIWHLANPIN